MIARGPGYYDVVYERIIRLQHPVVWSLMRERCARIAPHVQGGSVLDVACGLGLLAESVTGYTGVDFSEVATAYGWKHFPDAEFILNDAFQFLAATDRRFDTVILSEILEHVAHPARLYELAAVVATKRLVWTVPVDLPAPSHVWPTWPAQAVDLMLSLVEGKCITKEQFGGENGRRWWLVVQEVWLKVTVDTAA